MSAPRILYLVHDLADPAVARRVAMFEAGGARVRLAGFARSGGTGGWGERAIVLGRAREGRLVRRVADVLVAAARVRGRLQHAAADVVVARNLEMLALARRAALGPVVYECLDIHRLMLRRDPLGAGLRALERRLCRGASLLLTSSPAFVREHFGPSGVGLPVHMVENRVFGLDPDLLAAQRGSQPPRAARGGPVVIGWFGALRCRRSFDALAAFTRASGGRFEVVLRGRPAPGVLDDLPARAAREPHMRFEGAYRYPHDLPAIYGEVDLAWGVDLYEAGQNSRWLLPNRLYEAGAFGVPCIALADCETGRFLARHGLGPVLDTLEPGELAARLGRMEAAELDRLRDATRRQPPETWVCDRDAARQLVRRVAGAAPMRAMGATPTDPVPQPPPALPIREPSV